VLSLFLHQQNIAMITYPGAKINLGLNILKRREDGFHDLETVMIPVPFYDILEIVGREDHELHFSTSGISIPGNEEDNLCIRAFRMMQEKFDIHGVNMHLHKRIPMGAGLGGGSADGAFALMMINDLYQLGMSLDELSALALHLGSDCPFFILNKPAFAGGRGEILEPIFNPVSGCYIVMVKPTFSISTSEAYQSITPGLPVLPILQVIQLPKEKWDGYLNNDFETLVLQRFPESADILKQLRDSGAFLARMTGSGSVFYGLYSTMPMIPDTLKGMVLFSGWLL
jgi:4-diphosphocytidyl-2-C-methyl-D-erythritol kinase